MAAGRTGDDFCWRLFGRSGGADAFPDLIFLRAETELILKVCGSFREVCSTAVSAPNFPVWMSAAADLVTRWRSRAARAG
jgi:hypothetical protein